MGFVEVLLVTSVLFIVGVPGYLLLKRRYPDPKKHSEWRIRFAHVFFIIITLISSVFIAFSSMFIALGASESYLDARSVNFLLLPLSVIWFPLIWAFLPGVEKQDANDPHMKRDFFLAFLLTLSLFLVFSTMRYLWPTP